MSVEVETFEDFLKTQNFNPDRGGYRPEEVLELMRNAWKAGKSSDLAERLRKHMEEYH